MPARACASGDARVRSLPSKMIRPPLGMVSPARQLKNVDLPAPFGPISPMISPALTARSAPATARNSPNFFDTLVASKSLPPSGMASFPQSAAQTGHECREPEVRRHLRHLGCELRVQKRHSIYMHASVLIDFEVRTWIPIALSNFGIGTLPDSTNRTTRPARTARSAR